MSCTEARRLTLLGLEEFEAAIFDEGNIAPAEFDLERVAVMRGDHEPRANRHGHYRWAIGNSEFSISNEPSERAASSGEQFRVLRGGRIVGAWQV